MCVAVNQIDSIQDDGQFQLVNACVDRIDKQGNRWRARRMGRTQQTERYPMKEAISIRWGLTDDLTALHSHRPETGEGQPPQMLARGGGRRLLLRQPPAVGGGGLFGGAAATAAVADAHRPRRRLHGLMQHEPLLISGLIEHAAKHHHDAEIVSRRPEDGAIHRYNYRCAGFGGL